MDCEPTLVPKASSAAVIAFSSARCAYAHMGASAAKANVAGSQRGIAYTIVSPSRLLMA
jgi:hypothetical protein